MVNQSVSIGVEPHVRIMIRCLLLFDSYSVVLVARPLWRRVCLLYKLMALPTAVFLGSKSSGTRDHILLSQIWDFPFHRLLRLAGSRWRYSTLPPHGCLIQYPLSCTIFNFLLLCTLGWGFRYLARIDWERSVLLFLATVNIIWAFCLVFAIYCDMITEGLSAVWVSEPI
jgi:hypothetical protein